MGTRPLMETTWAGSAVAVLPDGEALSVAAAAVVVAEARRAVKRTGRFTIALSGGATPKPIYELLAGPPFAALVPWEATHVFWGDERCVEATDPRSNERMARLALLDHVPIPEGRVHPMRCAGPDGGGSAATTLGGSQARRAADDYERLLRQYFDAGGIDLVLLGIGDNGHTASLFPGSEVLEEQERWVAAAYEDQATATATSGTGDRPWRVTVTAPFINRAALALFVVSGASKAAVVKEAIEGDTDPRRLPARLIRPLGGRLWWLLDEEAASRLEGLAAYERRDDASAPV
jgi:6-phosphogluconolactonase